MNVDQTQEPNIIIEKHKDKYWDKKWLDIRQEKDGSFVVREFNKG